MFDEQLNDLRVVRNLQNAKTFQFIEREVENSWPANNG